MAFVFTVETGTGLDPAANSYASVAEADDYFAPDNRSASWDALLVADKENLLALSTRVLDIYGAFEGCKTVNTSPLRWPRSGVTDREGNAIGSTVIPGELKAAVYELARVLISTDLNASAETEGIKKVVVDVIEIEFQEGPEMRGVSPRKIPPVINAILNGIGTFSAGRRQFARIRKS